MIELNFLTHSINNLTYTIELIFNRLISNGELKDVAPTILALLGIIKPDVMNGQSLLEKDCDSY